MMYEDLFGRVLESVAGVQPHSWSAAQALAAELEGYSRSQQDALLQSPRFRGHYLLVRALCSRALSARFSEPERTLALADLAVRSALWLYESRPLSLAVDDLAESLASLGNARRMYGHLADAEVFLVLAERFSRLGSGDPEAEALILRFGASVEADREKWEASLDKALRAAELYRGLSCPDRLGQCLISAGKACLHLGNPQSAVPYLSVGLWQIREDSNPALALVAIHLLACAG